MEMLEFECLDSTNNYLALIASDSPHGTVVRAGRQTAGRGQRGNSWESAPGENILMSVLLRRPGIAPADQFIISQAVALAIRDTLAKYMPGEEVSVKWPNDIYVGNRKICGILIENSLGTDEIDYSIAGFGVNVNQTEFLSDAPNPVSMAQICDRRFDTGLIAREIAEAVIAEYDSIFDGQADDIRERYFNALWRRKGFHPYFDCIREEIIYAKIHSVAPDGHISLELSDNSRRIFAFKEVRAIDPAKRDCQL